MKLDLSRMHFTRRSVRQARFTERDLENLFGLAARGAPPRRLAQLFGLNARVATALRLMLEQRKEQYALI